MTATPLLLAVDLSNAADAADPESIRTAVAAADTAGWAFATFSDGPSDRAIRIEAGVRAAFVATTTDRIGLVPQLHVTTTEPFHLATQLASLDHASSGRAGWLVGAANGVDDLATIGASPLAPGALRREVRDVVEVARALWDSWQDDAVIRDVASGRYLDPDRVHHVDFIGESFTVKGPLITPRPPQGQVVVIAPEELDIDALADVVLIAADGSADGSADDVAAVAARATQARRAGALAFADVPVRATADLVRHLTDLSEVVDGVRLIPSGPDDLAALTSDVLPHFPQPYGATLRKTLGLPRPTNRHAA